MTTCVPVDDTTWAVLGVQLIANGGLTYWGILAFLLAIFAAGAIIVPVVSWFSDRPR